MRSALIITAGIIILALLVNRYFYTLMNNFTLRQLPGTSAGALPTPVGTPLAWRKLLYAPTTMLDPQGALGSLVSGNFDADSDEEAVVIGMKHSLLFELPEGRR